MAKKRRRRERRRGSASDQPEAPAYAAHDSAPQQARRQPASAQERGLPSPIARIAGAVLAVVTVVIAVLTVFSALSDDLAPVDVGVRLFAGLFLIALAIVIAALSIVPAFVRKVIAGG